MTVAELIEALQQVDPDLPVYVRGYESGINDVRGVELVTVVRDVHTEPYYGAHEIEAPDEDEDDRVYFYGQHRYPDEGASLPRTAGLHIWGGSE